MRFVLLVLALLTGLTSALAQGRYQPQGPAQRAYSDGERLREAGDALRAQGKPEEAREKYAEALDELLEARKADPAYIDVYVKLGLLYYSLARHAEAVPVLSEALKRAPDNLDLRFWYGQNLFAAGQTELAVLELEQVAVGGGERFPEVFLVLGGHWYSQRAYEKASPALERYLKLQPEATAARAQLGNTYFKLGRFAEALTAFEVVRKNWPDKVEVQVNIGNAHFQLGQYEKAVAVLEGALKQAPDRESVLFNLAQSYFKLGRFSESVPHYQRFVAARPDSFNGRYFLGSALMELGRDDEALDALARALRLKPEVAQPAYKIALIHMKNGRLEPAEATLAQAALVAPEDAWVKSAQGTLARQQKRYDVAIKLHREAAEKAPTEARLHANLAVSALAGGALEVAAPAIETALALDAQDPWVREAGAAVFAALARTQVGAAPEGAISLISRALTLRPGDPNLLANRLLAQLSLPAPAFKVGLAEWLAQVQEAAKARPQDADLRYAIGRAQLAQGDFAAAAGTLKLAFEAQPSPAAAMELTRSMVGLGQLDEACDLLDASLKSWPDHEGLRSHRARVRFARGAASLGSDQTGRRVASDLRHALEIEDKLPADAAAQLRYAVAVAALRRGEGKEARGHLAHAKGRFLKAGAPGGHLDLLIAFSDVLQRNHEQALERLGPCTGALEKRLCKYAWDRVAAGALQAGDYNRARKALEASRDLGSEAVVEHNLLVVAWQQKKGRDKLAAGWRRWVDSVPEALFNVGVAAEARGDHEEAWQAFSRYGRVDGPRAAEAREIADVKNRIYRFAEGGE